MPGGFSFHVERKHRLLAAAVVLVLCPGTATAQKSAFIDAFIAFHSALPGAYGDEGPRMTAELDRMTATLAAWERSGTDAENQLKARAGTAGEFALLYVDQQRLDAALSALDQAIAAEPNRSSLYVYRGQLLAATGRAAEARASFGTARRLDPDDPVVAYLVASALTRDSAPETREPLMTTITAAVKTSRAVPPNPFAEFRLIDDLAADRPMFAPAAYAEAFASMRAGQFRRALDQFRAALAHDPLIADPAARHADVRAGIAALRERRGRDAVERLAAAVASLPDSPEAHRLLGVTYRAVGELVPAIGQFETAVRLAPLDERARLALGTTLAEAGRLSDAERELRDAIRVLPASGEARWALADVLERQERGFDAIPVLEDASALVVVAGRAHLLWRVAQLAHLYYRDNDRVIALLSRRARLVPNEPHAHKDLGLAYHRAGRDEEARLELIATHLLGHEDAETHSALGQLHLEAGRLELAQARLARAVELDPRLASARYALARTLQRLGRADEAREQLAEFDRLRAARLDEHRRQFESELKAGGIGR